MAETDPRTNPAPHDPCPPREEPPEIVLRAEDLFGPRREIGIELAGVRYRLRITRRGKLILQK